MSRRPSTVSIGWAALCALVLTGCEERDRIIVTEPGDGVGPEAVITYPGRDTTIAAGAAFIVDAFARDADGLDTVYVLVDGPVSGVAPITPEGEDSVRFGVPLGTAGLEEATIVVRIFATDVDGTRGDTATRTISIP